MRISITLSIALALLLAACAPSFAQDWAKTKLEKSPRHLEWVTVEDGDRKIKSFIAYPEVKDRATAVVVIHEIFGLSDWVRLVLDQLAAEGFIAIAPDLLSGQGPNGGGTSELGGDDAARKAISSLPPDQITSDLKAVTKYVSSLPASNGKVAVAGFCWGGGQAFRFASNSSQPEAFFVFYGTGRDTREEVAAIDRPVYGFYAGNDERVNATLAKTAVLMKNESKQFKPVIFKGAGHGFMRSGQSPDAKRADITARKSAWSRMIAALKQMT